MTSWWVSLWGERPAARLVMPLTPRDANAQVVGRDAFRNGRHPDRVGAQSAEHADLRRGFVSRAEQPAP